jgi:plasmid stabilization system protein ParE
MVKLIWTDQAIDDLGDIGDYIAENSESYAKLTVKKLFERVDILKTFPQR